jgi:hypothetical protein
MCWWNWLQDDSSDDDDEDEPWRDVHSEEDEDYQPDPYEDFQ